MVDYDVNMMLRNGAYKLSSPSFTHPYVITQAYLCTLASVLLAGIIIYTSPRHYHPDAEEGEDGKDVSL